MKSASTSGLVRYLFGADLSGSLRKEDFVKLQADLISDVLEMEFTRYAEDTAHNISETDFCRHLLYSSSISQASFLFCSLYSVDTSFCRRRRRR